MSRLLSRTRTTLVALICLCAVVSAASAATAPPAREFVPVQQGFSPTGTILPPHIPDRLLVQLSPAGLKASRLELPMTKGATAATAQTGLPSLDAVAAEVGVVRIVRPFGAVKNMDAAGAVGLDRWFRFELEPGSDVTLAVSRFGDNPYVEHAVPDLRAFPAVVPNDPQHADNWGHNNTAQLPAYEWGTTWAHTGPGVGTIGFDADAESAWDETAGYGASDVIIAILDSGVDTSHPDLDLVAGYDFGDGDDDPDDDSAAPGHGTSCAGVAAGIANNLLGVNGSAGGCRIMPMKVADNEGALGLGSATNAVYWAADHGADVVSMSFGAAVTTYAPMDNALLYAFNAGVTLLAATGNENDSSIHYPANNSWVIAVGAASPCGDRKRSSDKSNEVNPGVSTDPNSYTCDGERWWGSNYGHTQQDANISVDVLAPTILPTTDISGSGGYQSGDYEPFFNGTSCATPYAAGVAALIKSTNPALTPAEIRTQLRNTATDVVNVESVAGWDRYSGYGLVDAYTAVSTLLLTPPTAAFSAAPLTGCAPVTVTFSDASTGDIVSWSWNFGDGGTDTTQNPSHEYTAGGTYDVTLIVTGPAGADTLVSTALVTVDTTITPLFSAAPTTGPAPLTVDFTNTTTGTPLAWFWAFGDATYGTDRDPSHTYTAPGTYSVTLITVSTCGNDTLLATDLIVVEEESAAPVAAFSAAPLTGCVPLEVTFTDASTGEITGRKWSFGDATGDTVQNPVHTYTWSGGFDVSLIVFGPGGADTLTLPGLVDVDTFVTAAFTPSVTVGPNDPLEVTFTDASTGNPTHWLWDFGDSASDTVQSPTHSYTVEGTYTVTLTAGNACGDDSLIEIDLILVRSPSGIGPVVPARFALGQNYPNPFNPATTITFSLAREGQVTLEIFAADGKRLETLLDETRDAGPHSVMWRPRTLASGVYFARLSADGETAVTRLVLLR